MLQPTPSHAIPDMLASAGYAPATRAALPAYASGTSLSSTPAAAVETSPYSPEQQNAIIQQIVLPTGGDWREPAIHVIATAKGYAETYQSLANAFAKDGAICNAMTDAIHQEWNELPKEAAKQAAESYCINRQTEALNVVQTMQFDAPTVQQSLSLSEQIRQGAQPSTALPPQTPAMQQATVDKKLSRMQTQSDTPLPIPRANEGLHQLAMARGHYGVHDVLEKLCEPAGAITQLLATQFKTDMPDITAQVAQNAASSYTEHFRNLAALDTVIYDTSENRIVHHNNAIVNPLESAKELQAPTQSINAPTAQLGSAVEPATQKIRAIP